MGGSLDAHISGEAPGIGLKPSPNGVQADRRVWVPGHAGVEGHRTGGLPHRSVDLPGRRPSCPRFDRGPGPGGRRPGLVFPLPSEWKQDRRAPVAEWLSHWLPIPRNASSSPPSCDILSGETLRNYKLGDNKQSNNHLLHLNKKCNKNFFLGPQRKASLKK